MTVEETSDVPLDGRLYSSRQVATAAFLGTPIAGVWLLAANYRVMGERGNAKRAVMLGLVATALLGVLVFTVTLPDNFPNLALPVCYTVGLYWVTERLQRNKYSSHIAAGGRRQPWWSAPLGIPGLSHVWVVDASGLRALAR